jgi:uncharacterized OB-fold protein
VTDGPPVPVPDVVSAPHWDALAAGRFELARCTACGTWEHPPQERCRLCAGDMRYEPVSGSGTVFSFIVVRRQFVPGHVPPEVVAFVELDEQPGLRLSALVDADPADVHIGDRVEVRIDPMGSSGLGAPTFVLAAG